MLASLFWDLAELPAPGSAPRPSISTAWGQDRCLAQVPIQTTLAAGGLPLLFAAG